MVSKGCNDICIVKDSAQLQCSTQLDVQLELAWLKNRAAHHGSGLIVAPGWSQYSENNLPDWDAVVCPCCDSHCVALPAHPFCGHGACLNCWAKQYPDDSWPNKGF